LSSQARDFKRSCLMHERIQNSRFLGKGHNKGSYHVLSCKELLLMHTPSVSKQKLHLDILCVTKQKVRLVKFLSNFVKRTGMLPETM
jgi:hypothetical protein